VYVGRALPAGIFVFGFLFSVKKKSLPVFGDFSGFIVPKLCLKTFASQHSALDPVSFPSATWERGEENAI